MKGQSIAFMAVIAVVSACGGSKPGGSVPGTPQDLTGLVVNYNGGPVSGAKVKVGSRAIVTTGADGSFAVQGVNAPYDIAVASADGSAAAVYSGLTRADPTVGIPLFGMPPPDQTRCAATITGHLSGGTGFPQLTGHDVRFLLTAPVTAAAGIESFAIQADGTFTLSLSWSGNTTLSATLRAVQFAEDINYQCISFDGAGSVAVTLTANQALLAQEIRLDPVTSGRVAGTVSVAPGYILFGRTLRAFYPPSDSLRIRFDDTFGGGTVSAAYDYPGFSAKDAVLKLTASAVDDSTAFVQAWRAGFALGSAVDLNVPGAPVFQIPTPSSTAVTIGSALSWTALDGAVYDMTVTPSIVGSGPVIRVVTSATSVPIPDLSAMGLIWPKAVEYRMELNAYGPHTADDVAGSNELAPDDKDGVYAASALRTFTTAP